MMPLGKVQMTPVPMVAGEAHRRRSFVGLVGEVVQAKALLIVATGLAGSSAKRRTGEVGVTPAAAGRPIEYVLAVAAPMKTPASSKAPRSVEAV